MTNEIRLQIIVHNPVSGLRYGLQKGKGASYETVQAQTGKGEDLTFNFWVQLQGAPGSVPSLAGPYVQGTPGARFIYLGIGSYAGQTGAAWNGRLNVPLPEATFGDAFINDRKSTWRCTVPGSRAQGMPVFATVKPFSGWSPSALPPSGRDKH